ncbi:DUF3923 family protein [Lactobacillus sp. PV034]|uniref:DUF3923 family protein n=1 Tax=Lactobacillus sp. PV034 TaxID=2594495 RepID=UPI00223EDF61|nr:DUF3923 family protein [Lactobacillus sp. PV034]QNQ81133.1 hypothetical protein FP432_05975 [Lactobacillus sp. PV034]
MKYWITSMFAWIALFSVRAGMILMQTSQDIEVEDAMTIKQNGLIILACFGMIVLLVHIVWLFSLRKSK